MKLRRTLLALLMILWLPVQGYAAIAMPFCEHAMHGAPVGHISVAAVQGVGDGNTRDHAHHSAVSSSEHASPAGNHHDSPAADCNDCGACHLACSPAVPPVRHDLAPAQRERFALASPAVPPLFVPEQPKRPPLAAVA
jgi:hypothetical protein